MDPGDQFFPVEGLDDIIIGTETEAADLTVDFAVARQDQNRCQHL
jgi:hypothetical protein